MQRSAALRVAETQQDDLSLVSMYIPADGGIVQKSPAVIGHEMAKGGYLVDEDKQRIAATRMPVQQHRGGEVKIMLVINPGRQYDFCVDVDPKTPPHLVIVYKPRKP